MSFKAVSFKKIDKDLRGVEKIDKKNLHRIHQELVKVRAKLK